MKRTKTELQYVLDETQDYIKAVETAQIHGLALAEETLDKYNDALTRQKEAARELAEYENCSGGIIVSAMLSHKEPEMRMSECVIEAVEEIPHGTFVYFKNHLLEDYEFINNHLNDMYCNRMGVNHCLLVLDEEGENGILVESEGYSYARYSGLLPDARVVLRHKMQPIADYLIGERKECVTCAELHDRFQIDIRTDNYFGKLLTKVLCDQKEIDAVISKEDSFVFHYVPAHCIRVGDLMSIGLEDVHLLAVDEEHDVATIVELKMDTLTEAGWDEWDDVLSARVEKIYEGSYGLQIDVSGCDAQRLRDFSYMLAGYCSEEDYDRWVCSDKEEQEME